MLATALVLPMPDAAVRAGFPSPAEDFGVMQAMDAINRRIGKGTVLSAVGL